MNIYRTLWEERLSFTRTASYLGGGVIREVTLYHYVNQTQLDQFENVCQIKFRAGLQNLAFNRTAILHSILK